MEGDGDPQAPAGWYPDPTAPGQQRYWDGMQWTEHTAAGTSGSPVGGAPGHDTGDRTGGHGAAGYGAAGAPSTWLWQSIVATVLCCLPAGIVGIVYAAQAQGAVGAGNLALAREKADKARTWTLVSVGIGLLGVLIWLVAVLGFGAAPVFT